MSVWLVLAPERDDDENLTRSAWVAQQTMARAPHPPNALLAGKATRTEFARHVATTPGLEGIAFFGHGADDRLFDADRPPKSTGPSMLDAENAHLLSGCWVHAFACLSGRTLGQHAVDGGASIYVGYRRPLDVGWLIPPPAEPAFADLVSCITLALLDGERDERTLRQRVSKAVDGFYDAFDRAVPDTHAVPGSMWLPVLAQQLVDEMVVVIPG